jgi:DNA-binding CsgD family transcriptional regulator/DNA-binding beta-propeller fold protein YncE
MRGDRRRSGLTSREREVLELVRVGLTNEEIAERLGISPDTAKFHVSQILAKLVVASREEAAALPDERTLPWWARALAWSAAAKAAVVAMMLAIVAGVAVMAWAVLATDSGDSAGDMIAADHLLYVIGGSGIEVIDPQRHDVVHTIATGSDPEFVVSPDGATLYLTDGDDTGQFWLSAIDTHDWHVINRVLALDRINNISPGSSGMAISADGRYVYVHEWKLTGGQAQFPNDTSAPVSDHWWGEFDTKFQRFYPYPPEIANCGISAVFPGPADAPFPAAVFCYQLQEVAALVSPHPSPVNVRPLGPADMPDTCTGDRSIAGATQSSDGTIYVVTRGGCVEVISRSPTAFAVASAFQLDIPHGWRIPYDLDVVTASGNLLYLGVGPGVSSEDLTREVWVIDPASGSKLATIPLQHSAEAISLSPDGRVLYAAGPETHTLTAIDTQTGEELWVMHDDGQPWVVKTAARPSP